MKIWWILLLSITLGTAAFGPKRHIYWQRVPYTLQEDFENGKPLGWSDTGSVNWSYSPALDGAKSILCDGTSSTTQAISPTFRPLTSGWIYFRFKTTVRPSTTADLLQLRSDASVLVATLKQDKSADEVWIGQGSSTSGHSAITLGQIYHCGLYYAAGAGSNGRLDLYLSTDENLSSSPTLSITTGTSVEGFSSFRFYARYGMIIELDRVRINASKRDF